MEFGKLTEEQKMKARACTKPEEILALAQEEGYDLSDEEMEGVSGGWNSCDEHGQCGVPFMR